MIGGSWNKREKAVEEQYFNKIEADRRNTFAEKLHTKELRDLIKILPENHNLSEEVLHKILEWKHGV